MGQQAVISHPDAQAQRNPVQRQCSEKGRPTEKEKGNDCANVKDTESLHRYPVNSISPRERVSLHWFLLRDPPSVDDLIVRERAALNCQSCVILARSALPTVHTPGSSEII